MLPPNLPSGPAGASLSDLLTVARQLVQALNNASQTYVGIQGAKTTENISAATSLMVGAGRVCTVNVIVAGSAPGAVYDANHATDTTNKIHVILNIVGIVVVNMPVSFGITVTPGTGQVVAVSWS